MRLGRAANSGYKALSPLINISRCQRQQLLLLLLLKKNELPIRVVLSRPQSRTTWEVRDGGDSGARAVVGVAALHNDVATVIDLSAFYVRTDAQPPDRVVFLYYHQRRTG